MSILMYHEQNSDGHVALNEKIIAGVHTPVRNYQQKGHFLEIDPPDHAREHDVEELQRFGHRLATPSEQSAYAKQQKQAGSLTESR